MVYGRLSVRQRTCLQLCITPFSISINIKKSTCMRTGSRHDKMCAEITMCDGGELLWVDEIRYLGDVIIRGAKFK